MASVVLIQPRQGRLTSQRLTFSDHSRMYIRPLSAIVFRVTFASAADRGALDFNEGTLIGHGNQLGWHIGNRSALQMSHAFYQLSRISSNMLQEILPDVGEFSVEEWNFNTSRPRAANAFEGRPVTFAPPVGDFDVDAGGNIAFAPAVVRGGVALG